jgi:hypothetical protein
MRLVRLAEVCANVAIVTVCCLIVWTFYEHKALGFRSPETNLQGVTEPSITGYSWSSHPETLLLAIRTGCRYCEQSFPFYKRLSDLQQGSHLKAHMVAVMPDYRAVGDSTLSSAGIKVDGVFGQPLDALSVSGTPTLLLLDAHGRVMRAWFGELTPRGEQDVLSAAQR